MIQAFNRKFKNPFHVDLAGVLTVGVLSCLFYMLFIAPFWQQQSDSSRLRNELCTQQAKLEQLDKNRRFLTGQLAIASKTIASSRIPMRSPTKLNEQLATISDIASKCGMRIDGMESGVFESNSTLGVQPISLSGRGAYASCIEWMDNLQKQLPDTSIRTLHITASPGSSTPMTTVKFDLIWCTQPDLKLASKARR